jgi:two-component system, chemotaxis family, sensor kinase CheA
VRTRFGDRFLTEYFAECEEHLILVRRGLLALEGTVGDSRPKTSLTEELFRSFHSLKGLAGMVEDRDGEFLAHEMESYLRALREGDVRLTTHGVETLIEGTRTLEATIAARHAQQSPPDPTRTLASLRALVGHVPVEGRRLTLPTEDAAPALPSWECVFTPSPELIARGVNVDLVRSRLRAAGEIINATPLVGEQGAVAFRFLVAGDIPGELVEAWRDDGMTCTRREESVDTTPPVLSAEPLAAPQPAVLSSGHYVRVHLDRLDELMRMIGDLVIHRARLSEALASVERRVPPAEWRAVQESTISIERQLRMLREGVMRVRLVPVDEIFHRIPFAVRDLARETGRRARVEISGQETQIDKYLVERMMDPILHLVRNSVAHGLESPAERVAAGKAPEGTIALAASASGDVVTLDIADDGRGVDAERVLERARATGVALPAGDIDDARLLDLICAPGFSTREQSDRVSGRGFGMAVVRSTVQDLGGSMRMLSTPGIGTRFTISLPLTLAITDALIARVGSHTFAVPQSAVREVVEIDGSAIRGLQDREMTVFRGGALPVIRLASVLGIRPSPTLQRFHAFIVGAGPAAVALLVDRIVGQREIVVRTTVDPLVHVDGISGATDLGDGRAVLILDVTALARLGAELPARPITAQEIA